MPAFSVWILKFLVRRNPGEVKRILNSVFDHVRLLKIHAETQDPRESIICGFSRCNLSAPVFLSNISTSR